ncbi:26S proteasome non-ATPase regulatory subunit 10-like [Diorhabda sublineata]|uniref:26S proteasome non-ATPase regulatory subunit 10-like n=1 Tax=Diorhabda sublineata TaxID=1163346 RepID=UPI0024E0E557|nr:26S proteasome non-ATPase regulatory subunit 10-like [Diorhabda sublineata]
MAAEPKSVQEKPEPVPPLTVSPYMTLIDDDKNTILHYAAARGKDEEFKKCIKFEELNMENYLGWTPLMMACRNKQVKTVKLLLQLGGDVTRINKFGMSVLHISISGGSLEIVKMIMEHLLTGGISKRLMQLNFSPLSMAILFRNNDILSYLIQEKFNLNAKTLYTGITPLMFASSMEDNEAFALLLKNKADTTIKNYLNETANDIRKARQRKKEQPKKLTPAELISRSPHMAPAQCFITPQPSMLNLAPSSFVCIRKASPSPTVYVATPNISPVTPFNVPQMFFPPSFTPNHFVSYSPLPMTNIFANANDFLNMNINQDQAELVLSPNLQ